MCKVWKRAQTLIAGPHNKVLKLIPDNVMTILDADCGGGVFMSPIATPLK